MTHPEQTDSRPALLLAFWVLVLLPAGARTLRTVPLADAAAAGHNPTPAAESLLIDPNTAEWWELTVIPGVGKVRAKAIVAYRTEARRTRNLPPDAPVFTSAANLQAVKGIGPKTAAKAEPYLTFPAYQSTSTAAQNYD